MRILLAAIVLAVSFCIVGCNAPLEDVTIIHTGEDEETGSPDQYTVIEFPDGARKWRYKHYGDVGDQFKARQSEWYQ